MGIQRVVLNAWQSEFFIFLLQEYASLQVGDRPQINKGMEPAVAEVPHDCTNTCNQVGI